MLGGRESGAIVFYLQQVASFQSHTISRSPLQVSQPIALRWL